MRVTGGILGSRQIVVPRGGVRPTQDRVREAMFSSLAARIPGCRFLDLFAGSGAVGLDAWSRGAAAVWWVERDPRTLAVLRRNVETLCGPRGGGGEAGQTWRIVPGDALRFLTAARETEPFDLIFADPPYDREDRFDWLTKSLHALGAGPMLAQQGIVIIEQAASQGVGVVPGWSLKDDRSYGESRLLRFERAG